MEWKLNLYHLQFLQPSKATSFWHESKHAHHQPYDHGHLEYLGDSIHKRSLHNPLYIFRQNMRKAH
ncbi:Uncharacterised protein [Serratia quinivorans]|nr:Uncharacterised protein [Serratia quinivorans]CAI2160620.1 Uncharacterised protein [Serratia quinivorans]